MLLSESIVITRKKPTDKKNCSKIEPDEKHKLLLHTDVKCNGFPTKNISEIDL